MIRKPLCEFFVASSVKNGGAYRCHLYENGKAEVVQKISMPSPMYLALQEARLWAVLRTPFANTEESGYASYDLCTGVQCTELTSTKGRVGCHIAVDGTDVYCANYGSGSLFKSPNQTEIHVGHGPDPVRQTMPHVHAVCISPCRNYIISCDLGLDTVFVYDRSLSRISKATVPAGAGVRHAVFSADGNYLYCINEMGGSISIFSWQAPFLKYLHTISLLPPQHNGVGAGAAIKLSGTGEYLYATERASRTIATIRINAGQLTVLAHTDCRGEEPRDFTLLASDRYAVCTNHFSNNVTVFQISENGIPIYRDSFPLEAPVCAIGFPNEHSAWY